LLVEEILLIFVFVLGALATWTVVHTERSPVLAAQLPPSQPRDEQSAPSDEPEMLPQPLTDPGSQEMRSAFAADPVVAALREEPPVASRSR